MPIKISTSSTTSVHTAPLGKSNCCICGKEIGPFGRYQMLDMTDICKDCTKLASPFFVPAEATASIYNEHLQQAKDGEKLYEAYFNQNNKVKKFADKSILVNEEVSLICFRKKRGGIGPFGGTWYSLVYRLADIEKYYHAVKKLVGSDGKESETPYVVFEFHNVSGLPYLNCWCAKSSYNDLEKYLNKAMGISGLKGVKNSFLKSMEQGAAIGNIMNSVKAAAKNPMDTAAVQDAAQDALENADAMFYAGREEILNKANEAIAKVLG